VGIGVRLVREDFFTLTVKVKLRRSACCSQLFTSQPLAAYHNNRNVS
jgi:hypothetical protein